MIAGDVAADVKDVPGVGLRAAHDPLELPAGTQVGRYLVERALGPGVYLARDSELDRPVLLEFLRVRGEAAAQVLREARGLAGLAHPNLITVLEVGEHEGAVFIAFEHLAGEPVMSWLDSDRPGVDEIVQVFRDAALGLGAAHAAGLVRGDLADGILVGPDRRVRVSFGAGRSVSGPAANGAPEVRRGESPTPASDQWSLASALRDALGSSAARRRVPARIARAIDRALADEPARRWPSMAALASALELPQRRTGLVVAAALGLALLSAGGVALSMRSTADDADPCAWVGQALAGVWDAPRRARVKRSFDAAGAAGAASATSTLRALDRYSQTWVQERASLCRASASAPPAQRRTALTGVCLARRREMLGALVTELGVAGVDRLRNAVDAAASLPRSRSVRIASTSSCRAERRRRPPRSERWPR